LTWEACLSAVQRYFEVVEASEAGGGGGVFRVVLGVPVGAAAVRGLEWGLERLYGDLVSAGCYPLVDRRREGLVLYLRRGGGESRRWLLAAGLAFATLASVYVSGLGFARLGEGFAWSSLGYLVGLLVPLVVHELGHWSVMRLYRVPSSLPYLIPAPPLQLGFLGTFGAVINLRWLPPSSDSLAFMAVMGPLAGYLAALPFAVLGVESSVVVGEREAEALGATPFPLTPVTMILVFQAFSDAGPGETVILSPLAFAANIVFIVTFLNLIPVAMLDGGHLARSILGERGHSLLGAATIALLVAASTAAPALTMFALLAALLYVLTGGRHPGPVMLRDNPGRLSKAAAALYAALLILTLPIPA